MDVPRTVDEPVMTCVIQTAANARKQRRNRLALRGGVAAAFIIALLAPSPLPHGDGDQPSNAVTPTVVEVTTTSHAPSR